MLKKLSPENKQLVKVLAAQITVGAAMIALVHLAGKVEIKLK